MVPLNSKQGQKLVMAIQKILSSGRKPIKLQTDQGTEYFNRLFQKLLSEKSIDFFIVNSGLKVQWLSVSTVRLRTKCTNILQLKTVTNIDVLPQSVKSYSNTYHRSIKMKPSQVTKANEAKVWDTLYGSDLQKRVPFKFQVADRVRISKVERLLKTLTFPILLKKCLQSTNDLHVKYLSIKRKMMLKRS